MGEGAWIRRTAALWSIVCAVGIALLATAPAWAAEADDEVDPAGALEAFHQFVQNRADTIPPADAPNISFLLTPWAQSSLTGEAQEHFANARKFAGHIMYDEALVHFHQAMEADPQHLDIRYVVAAVADYNSTKKMGDEALKDLQLAEKAYVEAVKILHDRIERRGELQWLLPQMASVRYRIANRKTLDKLRHQAGLMVLRKIEEQRAERMEEMRKPSRSRTETEEGQMAPGAGGGDARGGAMGMGGMAGAVPEEEEEPEEEELETDWDALLEMEVLPPSERIYQGPPVPWKELSDELYDKLLGFGSFTGNEAKQKAEQRRIEREMREAAKEGKTREGESVAE